MKKRIGDIAKAAGVGVETVRFYQRAGLVDEPEKPLRGWRAYGKSEQLQLRYVKLARHLGLSVADIAKLKKRVGAGRTGFCTGVRDVVAQRLAAIEADLKKLERTRDELAGWLALCKARGTSSECPLFRELNAISGTKGK